MKIITNTLLAVSAFSLVACQSQKSGEVNTVKQSTEEAESVLPEKSESIATLAGGCFWCTEAVFEQVDGIHTAVSGYTGGHVENPTYEEVCGKKTGHYEGIQVTFDPEVITYEEVLDWFWRAHYPTQANGQGHDIGAPYRPAIFVHSEEQKEIAIASKAKWQVKFDKPIATEIKHAETFYNAEDYHQDFYENNSQTNPYCYSVIHQKLLDLGLKP